MPLNPQRVSFDAKPTARHVVVDVNCRCFKLNRFRRFGCVLREMIENRFAHLTPCGGCAFRCVGFVDGRLTVIAEFGQDGFEIAEGEKIKTGVLVAHDDFAVGVEEEPAVYHLAGPGVVETCASPTDNL